MVDTQSVMSKADLLGTNYHSNANTGAIGSQNHRNFVASVMGCYAALANTDLSKPSMAVSNAAAWVELRDVGLTASPFTVATTGDTITASTATGRITIPSAAAAGVYRANYKLYISYGSSISTFTLPQTFVCTIQKNGTTNFGGLSIAQMITKFSNQNSDENIYLLDGEAEGALVANDYISLGGIPPYASANSVGTIVIWGGWFAAKRIG